MSTTNNGVEKQQRKTQIHLMYRKKVPQQRPNPEVVVRDREGIPMETHMMVETRTLPRRQLKNLTLLIPLLKEKDK
jgi:hypothetical protein